MDRSGRELPGRRTQRFGSRPRHAAHSEFRIDGHGRRRGAGTHLSGSSAYRRGGCDSARLLQRIAARRGARGARMKLLRILFMFCLFGAFCPRAIAAEFPNVRDDSYTEPNGSRVLKLSIVIDAPVDKIWKLLRRSDGLKRL